MVFGVTAASLTAFSKMSRFQVPLLIVSIALVGYSFWRLYFSSRALCTGIISRTKLLWLYWLSVPVILFFMLYPFFLPMLYGGAE
jgi:mercuric ion transport protein